MAANTVSEHLDQLYNALLAQDLVAAPTADLATRLHRSPRLQNKELLKEAGIDDRRVHDGRHSAGTILNELDDNWDQLPTPAPQGTLGSAAADGSAKEKSQGHRK
ncbi:hypothetical protein [Streptacidiphilus sp. PAMC 29251]